jgi:hypothetical protein
MSSDRDHFGIGSIGKFAMYKFKITCLSSPAGAVIDAFDLDFLFFPIFKCHQSEP